MAPLRLGTMLRVAEPHGEQIYACVFNQLDYTHRHVFATVGGRNLIVYRIEPLAAAPEATEPNEADQADGVSQAKPEAHDGAAQAKGVPAPPSKRSKKRKRSSLPSEPVAELKAIQRYIDADEEESFYACEWALDDDSHHSLIAVGGEQRHIKLIDANTATVVATLRGHGAPIYELRFLPGAAVDSSPANFAGHDVSISAGQSRYASAPVSADQNAGPSHQTAQIARSMSSYLLASASRDESIRLWHLRSTQCIAVFAGERGHLEAVLSIDFSPCASALASAGVDGTIKLWSITDHQITSRIAAADAVADEHAKQGGSKASGHSGSALSSRRLPAAIVQFPLCTVRRMHLMERPPAARKQMCPAALPHPEVSAPSSASDCLPLSAPPSSSRALLSSVSCLWSSTGNEPSAIAAGSAKPTSIPQSTSSRYESLSRQSRTSSCESLAWQEDGQKMPPNHALPDASASVSDHGGSGEASTAFETGGDDDLPSTMSKSAHARMGGTSLAYVDSVHFLFEGQLLSRGSEGGIALWSPPPSSIPSARGGSSCGEAEKRIVGSGQGTGERDVSVKSKAAINGPEAEVIPSQLSTPVAYYGTEQRGAERRGLVEFQAKRRLHFHALSNIWFLRQQLDPTRRLLAVGNYKGQVRLWRLDRASNDPVATLLLPASKGPHSQQVLASCVRCTAISAGMRFLACACDDGSIVVAALQGHLEEKFLDGGTSI